LTSASPGTTGVFTAAQASNYAEATPPKVPGFADLHRMVSMLLAERVPASGRLLVVGAGGGLELKALAEDHAGWTFTGIDPSADMLALARRLTSPHASRIELGQGYVETAPDGPFDGAACLLTLHFVPRDQRRETLSQIHRRLVTGAPFLIAHASYTQAEPERSLWISRHIAFSGAGAAHVESARQAMTTSLTVLSPQDDEEMLRDAGFSDVSLFYAGLSFRGWVCYA
jgi:tRNA (cmo5U34)-methyltransferase